MREVDLRQGSEMSGYGMSRYGCKSDLVHADTRRSEAIRLFPRYRRIRSSPICRMCSIGRSDTDLTRSSESVITDHQIQIVPQYLIEHDQRSIEHDPDPDTVSQSNMVCVSHIISLIASPEVLCILIRHGTTPQIIPLSDARCSGCSAPLLFCSPPSVGFPWGV
jgi:hypothetical protein